MNQMYVEYHNVHIQNKKVAYWNANKHTWNIAIIQFSAHIRSKLKRLGPQLEYNIVNIRALGVKQWIYQFLFILTSVPAWGPRPDAHQTWSADNYEGILDDRPDKHRETRDPCPTASIQSPTKTLIYRRK